MDNNNYENFVKQVWAEGMPREEELKLLAESGFNVTEDKFINDLKKVDTQYQIDCLGDSSPEVVLVSKDEKALYVLHKTGDSYEIVNNKGQVEGETQLSFIDLYCDFLPSTCYENLNFNIVL